MITYRLSCPRDNALKIKFIWTTCGCKRFIFLPVSKARSNAFYIFQQYICIFKVDLDLDLLFYFSYLTLKKGGDRKCMTWPHWYKRSIKDGSRKLFIAWWRKVRLSFPVDSEDSGYVIYSTANIFRSYYVMGLSLSSVYRHNNLSFYEAIVIVW